MKRNTKNKINRFLILSLISSSLSCFAQTDSVKIDLGSSSYTSPSSWNNLTWELQSINDLIDVKGNQTGIAINVVDDFEGSYYYGTTSMLESINLDSYAAWDSYFGSDENPSGSLTISNLNPSMAYSFQLFGSCNQNLISETQYVLEGANIVTTYLNPSYNNERVAQANNVFPKEDGTIIITASASSELLSTQDTITAKMELLFQSGFEPLCNVKEVGSGEEYGDIIGIDNTLTEKNDWINDLDNNPEIGFFNIQYQGGDESQRYAKIVSDPENETNQVLQFWLNDSNVEGRKGRIQANLYGNNGMNEIFQSVRMLLPLDDFNAVRSYPNTIDWLTIAEFWNNITWSQDVPYGFRITLTLSKPVSTESDLYFRLEAQDCELHIDGSQTYTILWSNTNTDVKVPLGEWFTLQYYYKEGDDSNGEFQMWIETEDGVESEIFDIIQFTHNSGDPSPDGITEFNPLKLYTSSSLINWMRSQNKVLQIYWDDLKLWKDK